MAAVMAMKHAASGFGEIVLPPRLVLRFAIIKTMTAMVRSMKTFSELAIVNAPWAIKHANKAAGVYATPPRQRRKSAMMDWTMTAMGLQTKIANVEPENRRVVQPISAFAFAAARNVETMDAGVPA